MYVPIRGIEQWIEIQGDDPANPALLYLHGGPGASSRPAAAAWRGWQRHFTLVHWDQRGTGRTLARNGETGCGRLSLDRMVEDGLAVAEFLRGELGKDKILLVAHSWGSILGVHMARQRPDLFSAYVGTGQVVDMRRNEEIKYRTLLGRAESDGNREALQELTEIGPPPHSDLEAMKILVRWADALARGEGDPVKPRPNPRSPDFTAEDGEWLMRGIGFSGDELFREIAAVDLRTLGLNFAMPVFFFQGMEDLLAPIALVEEYFSAIESPHKEIVRFADCHHFLVINRPDRFLAELLARVRHLLDY